MERLKLAKVHQEYTKGTKQNKQRGQTKENTTCPTIT